MKIKSKLPFVFTKDFWQGEKKQKEIAKAKYTLA